MERMVLWIRIRYQSRMDDHLSQQEVEAIGDALASGKKIEAIKIYREATGKGLKESKESIEALIPKLKEHDPDRFAKLSSSSGCTSIIVLAIATAALSGIGIWRLF